MLQFALELNFWLFYSMLLKFLNPIGSRLVSSLYLCMLYYVINQLQKDRDILGISTHFSFSNIP